MILGIDASNIRSDGGINHLKRILDSIDKREFGLEKVVIWSSENTLNEIEEKSWLKKYSEPIMKKNYFQRAIWHHKKLKIKLKEEKCDILFVPGGVFTTGFRPVVTMSQNLIPFEIKELLRYGVSLLTFKFILLRYLQSLSFRKANGTIFLTKYAKNSVLKVTKKLKGVITVIPHGIDKKFFLAPRPQKIINEFNSKSPFQVLYVSTLQPYKHHYQVIDAAVKLYKKGFPIILKLIGSGNSDELNKLKKKIHDVDPMGKIIKYLGYVSHDELPSHYFSSNIFLFASTCENMPLTLMEGMASGLPIVCSDSGPMPEILGDAGEYFDPENIENIAKVIQTLIESPKLRSKKAKKAFERAQRFSWSKCSTETFSFLLQIFMDYKKLKNR